MVAAVNNNLGFYCAEACSGITCSDCISSGAECAWCTDQNFTTIAGERCGLSMTLRDRGCTDIQNPQTQEDFSLRTDKPVADGDDEQGTDAIQLRPQAMHIKLRPRGKGYDFHVTFRPANNFPVDLYFLFDLSSTMKEYIKDFAQLTRDIADEIGQISKNYKMGYGTFQDKVVLPFTNTHPAKLENPCTKEQACAPPFDYRHELNLTRNIETFTKAVDLSTGAITGNIDRPEGGFDAMMQASVCKTVGWRDNSRQLIIMASDARMHFAGDGKLAGLITPNDAQCHLHNSKNSMANLQDYPSVGQLSEALEQSKQHVIFAVVGRVVEEYRLLQKRVPRSTVDELKSGSDSNVVQIVRDKYREMTKGVELEYTSSSKNIRVSITPTCPEREGSSCTNTVIGEEVNPFRVNIRAERCPDDPRDRVQTVLIAPSDFRLDTLNVTVELLCDCDCQISPDDRKPSDQCSHGNGTLECGICSCNEGRYGTVCECDQQDRDIATQDNTCRMEGVNSTTAPECNGFGECVCGVCQCQPYYSGRYCQCNDKVCPVYDDLVCGGNGECRCEQCYCAENFTGRACECPTSTITCMPPAIDGEGEVQVCSGHGACDCGVCACDDGFIGRHCEKCVLCGPSVCEDDSYNYRRCAVCNVTAGQMCPDGCPPVTLVPYISMEDQHVQQGEVCRDWLTEDCHVRFSVLNPGSSNITLLVQKSQVCTEGPDVLLIVLAVVGGVVGVGVVLLLLVKLLTSLFDRMEYQRFKKELESPKWAKHNNPIYKEATTTYYNPVMTKE